MHPELKRPSKRVRARTAFLTRVDWPAFERRVADEVRAAVERFAAEAKPGAPVSQVAIWADVRDLHVAVSFETRENARATVDEDAQFCAQHGGGPAAPRRRPEYNTDIRGFVYHEYATIDVSELAELAEEIDGESNARLRWAERRSGESLFRVVRQLAEEGVWDRLPREPELWIGVSTDRDWYDHVRRY